MDDTEEGRTYSGTAVAIVLIALMLAGITYRYWPSDEREIRRHLSNLSEVLSVPAGESEVQHLTRFAALREYFAPDVRVRFDTEQIVSREALVALISRAAIPRGGIVIEFVDISVRLAPDHQSADIGLTAHMASTDPSSGESTLDTRDAALTMSQADGDWVITTVESRESPARP